MIITRNHLPLAGVITRDDLDALGDIQVELEGDDLNPLIDEFPNANYFRNNDFSLWTRGTTAVALPHQTRTERADHWWARPDYGVVGSGGSGTFATYEQAADAVHDQWLYCAKLTGAVFTTALDFGQDIPARVAAALTPKITFTLEIENDTGAAITPTIRVDTCNTFESYGSMTNRISQAVPEAITNAEVKVWEVELDLTGFEAQMRNGAQIYVRFAGLNDVTKFVKVFAAKIEIGDEATERIVERDTAVAAAGTTAASETRQYFENPNFARWRVEEGTCDEDQDTFSAPGWFAHPNDGSTLIYKRSTVVPDANSIYSADLGGDPAVSGVVDFGQNLPRPIAAEARRTVVFSAKIYNGTGGAIIPLFRVDSCNAPGTFDDVDNQIEQALPPCADSAWTTVSYTFDAAGVLDFKNGARIYLRFPAGTFDAGVKSVRIAQGRLERGATASTFLPAPDLATAQELGAVHRGLKVSWTDATHVAVSLDEIVLSDRGGRNFRLAANSYPSVHLGTSGANGLDYAQPADLATWHYLWLASTGQSSAVFISKSATAPTLATGYRYRALLGAFRTDAITPEIPEFAIRGKDCWTVTTATNNKVLDNAEPAVADTFEEVAITAAVPPEAVSFFGVAGVRTQHDCRMTVAATASGLAAAIITGAESSTTGVESFKHSSRFELPQTDPGKLWWKALNKTAREYRIVITGFRLP